jgi:hypothetical protein
VRDDEASSVRRAYLSLYRLALVQDPAGLALAVRAIHDALPGAPLPAELPHAAQLARAGYTAREDLDGADVDELVDCAGLSAREATQVLEALR